MPRERKPLQFDPNWHQAERKPNEADAAKALASIPSDTRKLTERVFGDPLPGRSALDRREKSPNVRSPDPVGPR